MDTIESDSIVEAQVVAFAVDVSIYQNEAAYANSVAPSANGQINMFEMELNHYYWANIMTDFGQVKIIIARSLFPKNSQGLCAGNIIVGKVMLSGDVCIYDCNKYASLLNHNY
ncbi:MAG: hypothetical protein J6B54_05745 [Clostridia bacterium]|nr:hypothetical protein [Clostridia bacterium]